MPLYPVVNKETGETKELSLTIGQWEDWKKENEPLGWTRDWAAGCAGVGEVGEWTDKLVRKHPGWNDVLKKVSTQTNSNVRPY